MAKFRKRKNQKSPEVAKEEKKARVEGDHPIGGKEWKDLVLENADFEKYYRGQMICTDEEWPAFQKAMATELPAAFRITGSRESAEEIKSLLMTKYFPAMQNLQLEEGEEPVHPPTPLPFYPDDMAWSYLATRRQIRKCDALKSFHQLLVGETEIGNISRQEAVSMVPPLLLDVRADHAVLDMCAAPGSKTTQIVEMIHAECAEKSIPTGLVIANDKDSKRSYTLVHQVKRLGSPCLVVTNHDAAAFPSVYVQNEDGVRARLLFDRILADVPCSGDGTLRKNPDIWKRWGVNNAHGLFPLQCRILKRAIQMVKVGGRVVYSTCSLNPIENEAVVAAVLAEYSPSIRLVKSGDLLPGLKRRAGMTAWRVLDKKGEWYDTYSDVPVEKTSIKSSMFPPADRADIIEQLPECIRILPQDQNTGAFFVTIFEKVASIGKHDVESEIVVDNENEEPLVEEIPEEADETTPKSNGKKIPYSGNKEEPYFLMDTNSPELLAMTKQYTLQEGVPMDQFLVRSLDGKNRNLYFVSKAVKQIIQAENTSLKIVNTGIKAAARNSLSTSRPQEGGEDGDQGQPDEYCALRLHAEFLPFVMPFVGNEHIIDVSEEDFIIALRDEFPFMSSFSHLTAEKCRKLAFGGFIMRFIPDMAKHKGDVKQPISISVWRARTSLNVLMNARERKSLLTRIVGPQMAVEAMEDRATGTSMKGAQNQEE